MPRTYKAVNLDFRYNPPVLETLKFRTALEAKKKNASTRSKIRKLQSRTGFDGWLGKNQGMTYKDLNKISTQLVSDLEYDRNFRVEANRKQKAVERKQRAVERKQRAEERKQRAEEKKELEIDEMRMDELFDRLGLPKDGEYDYYNNIYKGKDFYKYGKFVRYNLEVVSSSGEGLDTELNPRVWEDVKDLMKDMADNHNGRKVGNVVVKAILVKDGDVKHISKVLPMNPGGIKRDEVMKYFKEMLVDKYSVSGGVLYATKIEIKFFGGLRGGCYNDGLTHDFINSFVVPGMKLKNPRSKDNNCLFACVRGKISQKITIGYCRQLRKKYGLAEKEMIPIHKAVEIYKNEWGIKLGVINKNGDQLTDNKEKADMLIMLYQDHYMLYVGRHQLCPQCGIMFLDHHDQVTCINMQRRKNGYFKSSNREMRAGSLKHRKLRRVDDDKIDRLIAHYDLETAPDRDTMIHTPYCAGLAYRKINNEVVYKKFVGVRCVNEMLKHLKTLKHIKFLNAFNGSGFDHYHVVEALSSMGELLGEKRLLISNGSIIKATLFDRISLVDISKHCSGTLKDNLESLGCEIQKGDFDHKLGQAWETMPKKVRNDCLKYLKADVLGLMELSEKMGAGCLLDYNCHWVSFISTSQMTYACWKRHFTMRLENRLSNESEAIISSNNIHLPTLEQENDFRKAIYGGRTVVNKKIFKSHQLDKVRACVKRGILTKDIYDSVNDYLLDLDANSLYPAAMLGLFPVGRARRYIKPPKALGWMDGKMSILYIKYVTNKDLLTPILPRRDGVSLKWDLIDSEGWYTNIDIENAIKAGYKVDIIKGWVWDNIDYVFKDYIETLYERKKKAKKGTAGYVLAKLFMNGLYGKTIQKPIHTANKIINGADEFWALFNKYKILNITQLNKKEINVEYSKESEMNVTKPTHLGCFVLSYSRRIMLGHMNSLNPNNKENRMFHYTDTDSLQCHISCVDESVDIDDKKLGSLSDDMIKADKYDKDGKLIKAGVKAGKIIQGYWIAPKLYWFQYLALMTDGTIQLKEHGKAKGLSFRVKLKEDEYGAMADGEKVRVTCGENRRDHIKSEAKMKSEMKKLEEFDGRVKTVCEDDHFSMRKFHLSVSDTIKEEGVRLFTIRHQHNDKILNQCSWVGRCFKGDISYPWGHRLAESLAL